MTKKQIQSRKPLALKDPTVRRITSASLLSGHRKMHIEHDGAVYSLSLTRYGNLVLTK